MLSQLKQESLNSAIEILSANGNYEENIYDIYENPIADEKLQTPEALLLKKEKNSLLSKDAQKLLELFIDCPNGLENLIFTKKGRLNASQLRAFLIVNFHWTIPHIIRLLKELRKYATTN